MFRKPIHFLLIFLFLEVANGQVEFSVPPNIIIFLMDDMGIGDCRAYNKGSKVHLPNLEKLAKEGIRFTDAHAPAAVCAPTRYSILTGNYPWRGRNPNGTWLFNMPSQVLPGQQTIGQLFKKAGYHTAFLGKVHLGGKVFSKSTGKPKLSMKGGFQDFDFSRKVEDSPASLGFDYAYELPQGIQGSPYIALENGILVGEESKLREWKAGQYGDSVIEADGFGSPSWDSSKFGPILTQKALSFISKHFSENQSNGIRKPFFMHYSSQSCHVPHTPPEQLDGEKIKGVSPDAHLDMIVEADVTLGKIISRLKSAGELENTLIIFTSDNGGLSRGSFGKYREDHNSNEGFRGSKAQVYEGGHRVPFIARWGNGNKDSPISAGSHSDALIGLQDLYATFAELLKQPMGLRDGLDSQSFLGSLVGEKIVPGRTSLLIQANNGKSHGQQSKKAVRESNWKLITTKELKPIELYDLSNDPLESKNRIAEDAQISRVRRMAFELKRMINSSRSTEPFFLAKQDKDKLNPRPHSFELLTPRANLICKINAPKKAKVQNWGKKWKIEGTSPLRLSLIPGKGNKWDISGFKLVGISLQNWEAGVTTIEGRMNNGNLTSWSNHAVGFGVAPSWEKVTFGFPFPMIEEQYKGSNLFQEQLAKPNGHRVHWRKFYPQDVREIILDLTSSSGRINALLDAPILAWPDRPKLSQVLESFPYLDELGQVRAVQWPGKATSLKDARITMQNQFNKVAKEAEQRKLSKFGGWLEGPKIEATGRFRTQKVNGKWWLVDPEGYLFFSVGTCLTGWKAETLVNQKRNKNRFFTYLPGEKDYLRWEGIRKFGGKTYVNFPAINYRRYFGNNWEKIVKQGTHNRMRSWGVNTLGCWSDDALQKDRKTPYSLISSIWWQQSGHRKFPSPFRKNFQEDLEKSLKKLSWSKGDPFCMGIFIGNELEWPDKIGQIIQNLPADSPTKRWAVSELEKLGKSTNPLLIKDLDGLYLPFARAFFEKCKAAINKVLPETLYLGCRTHRGPSVLGEAALGLVDVFSVNVYDSRVRSWQLPQNLDIPILASEFHFGAVDRGVPSPGLSGSWNQRQRGYSFAHYLASALADRRFVGVHWFQWLDQSASGRNDRENHQCGFIDVAGRAYPEFTKIVSQGTQKMYQARHQKTLSTEQILADLLH